MKEEIKKRIQNCPTYIWCGIILIIMSIIMFHDFLLGNKYFLFPNIVTDGTSLFYPSYMELAEKLADNSSFQWFSFASSWGSTVSITNPFGILIIAFGKENVAYMIGIVTMFRLILAGSIFSAFLEQKGMSRFTTILLGICYAFSTQVFAIGCWRNQAELAIITALFLLAIERFKKYKKRFGFVVASCLAFLCLSLYYLLTLGAFLVLYIIAEYIISNVKREKKVSARIVINILVIVVCLIVGGLFIYFQFSDIFQSTRFQQGVQSLGGAWKKTFSKLNIKIVVTAFLRTLVPNILGIPGENTYYGSETGWYIGDGGYYCGVLILLICLNAFGREKRKNWIFSIALLGCASVICCPAIRLITNGFADQAFKLTRMWVTVILLYIAAYALEEIFKNREKFKLGRVAVVWGVLVVASLILVSTKMKDKIYYWDYSLYFVFSFLYLMFLVAYKKGWLRPAQVKCLILCVTCIELLTLNYQFVNNSDAVEKAEWENGYYNDGTEEIIDSVREEKEFYRVDKSYCSVLLNDGLVQDYNGTMYSKGGIGNDNQMGFLKKFSAPLFNNMKEFCYGFYGYPEVEALMSVKYIVTQENANTSYGFEEKNNLKGKTIYENTNWLPLGFCYDKIMTSSQLEQIAPEQRKEYLLDYLVVDQEVEGMKAENSVKSSVIEQEPQSQLKIDNYVTGTVIEVPQNTENDTIVITVKNQDEIALLAGWSSQENWDNNLRFANVYEENGVTEIVLSNQKDVQYIILHDQSGKQEQILDEVQINIYNTEQYYKRFEECISQRNESVLEIEDYSDEYIKGTIENKENQLLFLSVPYNAEFEYYVDGQKAEKIQADYAFTAIYLEKGAHTVEMVYQKENINKVKMVCLLLLIAACIGGISKIRKRIS